MLTGTAVPDMTKERSLALALALARARLGRRPALIQHAAQAGARRALMAGQITPGNLFNLRPDFRALLILLCCSLYVSGFLAEVFGVFQHFPPINTFYVRVLRHLSKQIGCADGGPNRVLYVLPHNTCKILVVLQHIPREQIKPLIA